MLSIVIRPKIPNVGAEKRRWEAPADLEDDAPVAGLDEVEV